MRGMDIMATRVAMPLGAEQANALQAPSVASDGQKMSFAKSFGEVAVDAGARVNATSVEQTLKEKVALLTKGTDAAVGVMDTLPKTSADEGLKGAKTLADTTGVQNLIGETQPAQVKASEKPADTVPLVVDEKTASGEAPLRGDGVDVAGAATSGEIGRSVEPMDDVGGVKAAVGTKIDLMEHSSASKVTQALLVSDGGRSTVQKKEAVTATSGVDKTRAKKEIRAKSHASVGVAVIEPKNNLGFSESTGVQVTVSVAQGGVAPVVAKGQEIDGAEGRDLPKGVAARGDVEGIGGGKSARSGVYGTDRTIAGTSVSDVSKGEKTPAVIKVDDGFAQKDEAVSSKVKGNVAFANKWIEGKTHNSDGVITVPGEHGVLAVPGNVAGDAVGGKVRSNTTGAATAGQDGVDAGTAGVGDGHRTLEATPTSLEVGVTNGTHGWLKIRAEMADGGVVNASVSATTSAGQEMLHRELPSLTAYLQDERIGVGSVVLHATAAAGSREFAGGMESDTGREQMQQRGGQEGEGRQDAMAASFSDSGEGYFQGGLGGAAEVDEIGARSVYAGGSWLSIRA